MGAMVGKAEEQRRVNYHYMADAMRMLEWDLHQRLMADLRIPEEWHEIARDKGERKKTRVTIRLDDEIARFFRSTGADWQPRLNRVLSVWMHARLAGMIRGAETMDYMKRRIEDGLDGPRPRWGDLQRMEEEVLGDEATGWDEAGVPLGEERVSSAVRRVELDGKRG
ncbi:BrnA antitoxin family protein [Paracoccus sp. MBLB3053]|uniref:BrnA antitoxin family protein n=1 Tax=Paracoccus aurantius TaxID=3073814 RepID=A0ABU2HRG2_9RHOB|nr:BrnA antitoxin family protein [Paracoccus sp. MBLB3053]MDS9467608.1 BrnA antitoxin family protein [Paracoccus sp. MBLB3053]